MEFRGREEDLRTLQRQYLSVKEANGSTRGRAVVVTGRRRVGKSRLLQEFCDRSGVPHVVFQATRGRHPAAERADFVSCVGRASLSGADLFSGTGARDWNAALRSLAAALPDDTPTIVVLDEVPWLIEQDTEFEGALQTVWDHHLSAKPVLLVLVGSDLSVMEALQTYGRPFFGRAGRMVVRPLNLADVRAMTELPAAEAVDALLITGGFPELVRSWKPGTDRRKYLREACGDPLSPLVVAGELSLLGEFPGTTRARSVLEAIGAGERTFGAIAASVGGSQGLPSGTLTPILAMLRDKRVVETDQPLSTTTDTKNKRYRIADPYLRFWLAFMPRVLPFIERGRGDVAFDRIERSWTTWRGRAVEPLIRESLLRLLPDGQWPDTSAIGGWWNRRNNPELDLVGADRESPAGRIHFVGSVKWLENRSFDRGDHDALVRDLLAVPGTDPNTPLVAVSRSGVAEGLPLAAWWGPEDLVRAWEPR
ncbi:ATP-binding protein [Streptomyces alkaliphilus]|uniref:ATP-binding protein n=1 Tax=Streptomyces alkaliphilus TaxID=1472722 RepID=UPI00117F0998|nr:AAA family ATPase [Streptomyces alkaliphilus]